MTPAERQREAQIQYVVDALTDEDDPFACYGEAAEATYQQAVQIVDGQRPTPAMRHNEVPYRDVRRYGVRIERMGA